MRALNNISKQFLECNLNLNLKELISTLVEVLKMVLRIIQNAKLERVVEEEAEEKHVTADSSNILVSQQDDEFQELYVYFPTNVKPKEVIDFLIDIGNAKQENGTFWLRFDTDWYITYKTLLYKSKLKCKLQHFSEIVQRYVVSHITDEKHRKRISCNYKNLKVISDKHPYRRFTCIQWKQNLRDNPTNLALRRAVKLYNYLNSKLLLNSVNI